MKLDKLILLGLLLCLVKASSQDIDLDLKKMQDLYNSNIKFQYELWVQVDTLESNQMISGEAARCNGNYYQKANDQITLVADTQMYQINESRHLIYSQKVTDEISAKLNKQYIDIDTWKEDGVSYEFKGVSQNQKRYVFSFETGEMSSVELYINNSSGFPDKIVIHSKSTEGNVISTLYYKNVELNIDISQVKLLESDLVYRDGQNRLVVTEKYSEYTLTIN